MPGLKKRRPLKVAGQTPARFSGLRFFSPRLEPGADHGFPLDHAPEMPRTAVPRMGASPDVTRLRDRYARHTPRKRRRSDLPDVDEHSGGQHVRNDRAITCQGRSGGTACVMVPLGRNEPINGWLASYVYRADADPRELWLVVVFESREAYPSTPRAINRTPSIAGCAHCWKPTPNGTTARCCSRWKRQLPRAGSQGAL